jgi:hypothetical protein
MVCVDTFRWNILRPSSGSKSNQITKRLAEGGTLCYLLYDLTICVDKFALDNDRRREYSRHLFSTAASRGHQPQHGALVYSGILLTAVTEKRRTCLAYGFRLTGHPVET